MRLKLPDLKVTRIKKLLKKEEHKSLRKNKELRDKYEFEDTEHIPGA